MPRVSVPFEIRRPWLLVIALYVALIFLKNQIETSKTIGMTSTEKTASPASMRNIATKLIANSMMMRPAFTA